MPGPDGSWDTHRNNFPTLRNDRCPVFDHTFSALIADLHDRGLLETTMVVAGRRVRALAENRGLDHEQRRSGGRDHWPECYTARWRPAPAFNRAESTVNRTDGARYPKLNPVHPFDLLSTVFHAVGIDPETEYRDNLNRPRRLVDHGEPVLGLTHSKGSTGCLNGVAKRQEASSKSFMKHSGVHFHSTRRKS